ncbi:TrmH family RNA methyltransferase [Paramicrobacterium agarici]|uniref:TrmH family RNA methyltransferase n=1 Tax=Paramicrobacterium agarici TaxID=630514 RepID=UPI0011541CD9|nr:RNA methyltransferase [Microbacterium agarici]TQO21282.1 tRNA G18 (ribose-2'-O)-methylase SpoU [Microbacterium agarici]
MHITPITDLNDPALRDYSQLTDVALRRVLEPQGGLYLAESPKVIRRALAAGHKPRSVLLQERWLADIESDLAAFPDVPVYVGTPEVLEQLTGFHMHRGALASMHRPELASVADTIAGARRIVILEDIVDHTNVGAIFRAVAGIGADAVLVGPRCADPLYRRSVRVSMGCVLQVPWTRMPQWSTSIDDVKLAGFHVAALALDDRAIALDEFSPAAPDKLALCLGAEGDGLSPRALHSADSTIVIPMMHGVDSLNVASASAVALWELRVR